MTNILDAKYLELSREAGRVVGHTTFLGDGMTTVIAELAGPSLLIIAPLAYHRVFAGTKAVICNPERLHWLLFKGIDEHITHVYIHPGAFPRTASAKCWKSIISACRGRVVIRPIPIDVHPTKSVGVGR